MNSFLYIKATHIIGVVCWFAGLFYIVRLFIYHVEAQQRADAERKVLQEQFGIMERRLWYGITVPSMWVTLLMGGHLVGVMAPWTEPWFHIKALAVVVLLWYHHKCGSIRKQLEAGNCTITSAQLRGFNEIATVLLVTIVMTVVVKSSIHIAYGMVGFVVIALVLFFIFRRRLQGKGSKGEAGAIDRG